MEILMWILGLMSINGGIIIVTRVLKNKRKIKLATTKATLDRYLYLNTHLDQVISQIAYEEKELKKLNNYNNTPVEERVLSELRRMIQKLIETKASLKESTQDLYQKALPIIEARERAAEILRKKREAEEDILRASAKKKRDAEEVVEKARRKKRNKEEEEERSRRNSSSYASSSSDYGSSSSSDNSSYDGGGGSSSGGGSSGDW